MAKQPTPEPVDTAEMDRVIDGAHHDPHSILGPHLADGVVTIRVLRPMAESVAVVVGDRATTMQHEHRGV